MLRQQRSSIPRAFALVIAVVAGFAIALGAMRSAAQAAPQYTFTKVADSAQDGFDPFSFECSAINNRGDIAFRTARAPRRGTQLIQGIYRANADGRKLTTITEVGDGFDFLGQIPSINDEGQVSFALRDFTQRGPNFLETQSVLRGSGMKPTTIATTADDFNRFGFEPTVNNEGVVAFKADLDNIDTFDNENGLFSGQDGKRANITTHYLSSNSQFSEFGTLSRPSINNLGNIAFEESVDSGASGIFVGPDPIADRVVGTGDTLDGLTVTNLRICDEGLNDSGQLAFQATFNDPSLPDGRRVAVYRATPAP
jgi:hypothetical protein